MPDSSNPRDNHRIAEAVRRACLEAALAGYEDALLSGLCREGAWEVAVDALRSLDLGAVANDRPECDGAAESGSEDLTAGPGGRIASPESKHPRTGQPLSD